MLNIKFGETGYAYILNSERNVVIHPREIDNNSKNYDFVQNIVSTKNGTVEYDYKGVKKIGYYKYFEPWKWCIIITADYDELIWPAKTIMKTTIYTGVIIIDLGVLISLFMANNFVKPINKLKKCMEIAEKDDLKIQCDVKSNDEI